MAKVSYPLRDVGYPYAVGARSEALLLVNGNPPILDVDELTKLDKSANGKMPPTGPSNSGIRIWSYGAVDVAEPCGSREGNSQTAGRVSTSFTFLTRAPRGAVVKRCSFLMELRRHGKISGNNLRRRRGPTSRLISSTPRGSMTV